MLFICFVMAIAFALPSPSNEGIVSEDTLDESSNPTDDKEVVLLPARMLMRVLRLLTLG